MKKIVLRTYDKLWNIPYKIYSIDNLKLIVPLNPWDLLIFIVALIFMILISKVLFFIKLPFVFKYILIPWAVTKIIDNVKLDGKKPHKYFFDMVMFFVQSKKYERFKPLAKDNLKGFKEDFLIRKNKNELINVDRKHKEFMDNINVLK
jgi:hypothetical protein